MLFSIKPEIIKEFFVKVKKDNNNNIDIILSSYDGLSMISTIEESPMDEAISVMSSELFLSFDRFKKDIQMNTMSYMTIEGDNRKISLKNIENIGILSFITDRTINICNILKHINDIQNYIMK